MSGFSGLSYAEIQNIANTLKSKSNSMQAILNDISTQLNKVGNEDTWSGTAAASVFEEFNTLMKKFPEFYEAIDACSTYLTKTVERYQAVDKAVSQI